MVVAYPLHISLIGSTPLLAQYEMNNRHRVRA